MGARRASGIHGQKLSRKLQGVNNTLQLPGELAGIISDVCQQTRHSCDVLIKVRPSDSDFLNPHDSRVGYADFTVEVQEVGRMEDAHGLYRTNGSPNGSPNGKSGTHGGR